MLGISSILGGGSGGSLYVPATWDQTPHTAIQPLVFDQGLLNTIAPLNPKPAQPVGINGNTFGVNHVGSFNTPQTLTGVTLNAKPYNTSLYLAVIAIAITIYFGMKKK